MIHTHTTTLFVVVCDNCGRRARRSTDTHTTVGAAIEEAIHLGWDLEDEATCPACLHELANHWRNNRAAFDAAAVAASKTGRRHRVRTCSICGLWTIGEVADD